MCFGHLHPTVMQSLPDLPHLGFVAGCAETGTQLESDAWNVLNVLKKKRKVTCLFFYVWKIDNKESDVDDKFAVIFQ